ncbi:nucleic-acid-binding protein from transposon X-element [Trichonephila inaurata madagascariensis]|uniref:Nucleic-acid-binding protein from transposon X-element n=1 Tax=Trichonephila inaurata madagascariensis TaxID=2747483 RepID=A0A8X6XHT7_9ARAC|nr:nucleic-acid-binding protein from transposon X-element [Trichonephila inaurata madagascariensis]
MADNKQLKAVIRGLPTDYDQKEIASELKGLGSNPATFLFCGIEKQIQTCHFYGMLSLPGVLSSPPVPNRAPKCLKCSGSHLTADCKKSTKSPAKCANCGGPHPANFSGCPSNPVNRKQQKKQPNKNIWTEKAKELAQKSTPLQQKPSYAAAVGNNTPSKINTFDAKSIMQQMALMMT